MKYNKPPVTISDQIAKLKARGLLFNNEQNASQVLSVVSFYRLRAYTYPFQDNENPDHPVIKQVSFEQILELYLFDHKLRNLIFDIIGHVEVALRTQIIYLYAMKYGSHWQLKPELYRDPMRFANHLDSLQKEIERSDETFIGHYKNKYSDPTEPPSWMSLEIVSFGLLSKIFQNLKKGNEKITITRFFGLTEVTILENWMFCFSNLRNICAHHSRLWNRRLTALLKIPIRPVYKFLNNSNVYPNKLYAVLCCLAYILKIVKPDNRFSFQLKELMKSCPLMQEKEMGFPKDWQNEPLWQ